MPTLLLSSRYTEDDQALWRAAIRRDWSVERVRGIRVPKIDDDVVLHIESLYAHSIAEALGIQLYEPAEDWLVQLPIDLTLRRIQLMTLAEARARSSPSFVKPPNDKSFEARVYSTGADLPKAYDDAMPVLVAEPVQWEVEYRCFVLDGRVCTMSPYLRNGRLAKLDDYAAADEEFADARQFAERVLRVPSPLLPRAVALDVGRITNRGWAVVEANAAWGAGIYGCDPDAVLDVLQHATT